MHRLGSKLLGVLTAFSLIACGSGAVGEAGSGQASNSDAVSAGKCPLGPTVSGIDVSEFQGAVNWGAVKASGQAFAIARVSDGTGHIDATFAPNWAGIRAAGMIRGAYQFFEPSEDAVAQANVVIARVGRLGPGDLPARRSPAL